jgi:hypothetical protein
MPTHKKQTLDMYFDWEQRAIYDMWVEYGVEGWFKRLPELSPVFEEGRPIGCCMDSRLYVGEILGREHGYVQGVPVAGALILLAHHDMEKVKEFVLKSRIEQLCGHSGCGAGKILYRLKHDNQDPPTRAELDFFVFKETEKLAIALGIGVGTFIGSQVLRKSPDVHPARSIAYIGVPAFSPFRHPMCPLSFRTMRMHHALEDALDEVELATGIIMSPSGYNERITTEKPIWWLAIGNSDDKSFTKDVLIKELEDKLAKLSEDVRTCVKIGGFNWSPSLRAVI